MGIRMTKARLIATNEKVEVNNATLEMRKNKLLKCYTEKCKAKVTWVKLSKKNYEIEKNYFSFVVGEKRSENCGYNTLGQVAVIASKTDNKIIENINDNKYEFRLNIVYEALTTKENKEIRGDNLQETIETERKEKKYKSVGSGLPYLAVMKDIMKLRSEIEDNKELETIIKIKDKGKSISWTNFYYEIGEEEKLYRYIEKNGYVHNYKPKRLRHPICIEGVLDKEIQYKEGGNSFINLKLDKYIEPDKNGDIHFYKCTIITRNKEIINHINDLIRTNKRVKIVSYFIPSVSFMENDEYKNYKINGWINYEEQIYIEYI